MVSCWDQRKIPGNQLDTAVSVLIIVYRKFRDNIFWVEVFLLIQRQILQHKIVKMGKILLLTKRKINKPNKYKLSRDIFKTTITIMQNKQKLWRFRILVKFHYLLFIIFISSFFKNNFGQNDLKNICAGKQQNQEIAIPCFHM